ANARCLVFPIQWDEPFGIVMIEAMACGTPVVALPGGSVEEVIADGKTGFICADASELPAAISRAGELDAAGCRAHVQAHFDISRMVSGYVDVYRKAIVVSDGNRISLVNELSLTQLEARSSRQLPSVR
ncbi:MAG TPA: glycosyltransferase, partial [Actinomycetota bacterium]|nr:glycosyltransferase [Actinomycetota bacterium]